MMQFSWELKVHERIFNPVRDSTALHFASEVMEFIVRGMERLQQQLWRWSQSARQEENGMGVTYAQQTVYAVWIMDL
jgi:hypothetical protein